MRLQVTIAFRKTPVRCFFAELFFLLGLESLALRTLAATIGPIKEVPNEEVQS